jgi:uncharacterized membrane protein (DUF485 family)
MSSPVSAHKQLDFSALFKRGGNMAAEVSVEQIQANPKFQKMVSTRNTYSNIMTVLMLIAYFGYILLIAFNKPFLATKVAAGATMSVGVPMGIGVLVFTIIITWIYVSRANGEFDAMKDEVVREATK